MSIRGIVVRGDFTQDEFNRIVALVREMDRVPGRLLHVSAIGSASIDEARSVIEQSLPEMPGHDTSEIVKIATTYALTDAEVLLAGSGFCPDCNIDQTQSRLREGPHGGMNQNFACDRCGAEFNIAKHGGVVVWGQRLSPFGEPNIERLKSVYGITL